MPGTFWLAKDVTGGGADEVPDATTFTVAWEVTGPEGSASVGRSGTVEVAADGTVVNGPADLVEGDQVTSSDRRSSPPTAALPATGRWPTARSWRSTASPWGPCAPSPWATRPHAS
ncbi:hypothetical protein [Isoptericola sp. NPDC055063]